VDVSNTIDISILSIIIIRNIVTQGPQILEFKNINFNQIYHIFSAMDSETNCNSNIFIILSIFKTQ